MKISNPDNKVKYLVDSGKLEAFALGLLDDDESEQVKQYIKCHPELGATYANMRKHLWKMADDLEIPMPPAVQKRLEIFKIKERRYQWIIGLLTIALMISLTFHFLK